MHPRHTELIQLAHIYFNQSPLPAATPTIIGPFTLFVPNTIIPYYARPHYPSNDSITLTDLEKLHQTCQTEQIPLTLEWIDELHPQLTNLAQEYNLQVEHFPLYALSYGEEIPTPNSAITVELLSPSQKEISQARAVAAVAFAASESVPWEGVAERNIAQASISAEKIEVYTDRVRQGITHLIVARDSSQEIIACGQIQPITQSAELLIVATLPAYRRQGFATAVTSALITHAWELGITQIFLSAQDATAARLYEKLGFRRIGTVAAAEESEILTT